MRKAFQIQERAGWSRARLLTLTLQFVQDMDEDSAFLSFLQEQADDDADGEDEDIEVNHDDDDEEET